MLLKFQDVQDVTLAWLVNNLVTDVLKFIVRVKQFKKSPGLLDLKD